VAALSLPGSLLSSASGTGGVSGGVGGVQLGEFDAGNGDYGWKISGFTQCSATCGGGKRFFAFYIFFKNSILRYSDVSQKKEEKVEYFFVS
jgi:hypothetical protein